MSSMDSLWNPSLRKTLSHPAAAHKVARSGSQDGGSSGGGGGGGHSGGTGAGAGTDSTHLSGASYLGGLVPSKSVKHSSRSKLTSGDADSMATGTACPAASPPGRAPSKKGLFEGFRNTLRQSRGKGDSSSNGGLCSSHSLDRSGDAAGGPKGVIRRWSEISPSNNPQAGGGQNISGSSSAGGSTNPLPSPQPPPNSNDS